MFRRLLLMQIFLRTIFAATFASWVIAISAQVNSDQFVKDLTAKLKSVVAYDHTFPREKVFVHLDNNAYLEGDTIWELVSDSSEP